MQKVKGTYDVLPSESYKWLFLEKHIHQVMKKHQIDYVRTPVFEYFDVFHRQSEVSDMVTKETYDFEDRSGRKITLRPEGTAGVIRSIIENKLITPNHVLKTYYLGANYRYERPQKGRFREFYQTGVEVIGDKHALLDAEVIQIAYEIVNTIGIKDVVVKINHLGDAETRLNFKNALKAFLEPLKDQLSEDSKMRLESNPLRILDSKVPSDQALLKGAPVLYDFLTESDQKYFTLVTDILKQYHIPYIVDEQLVRGLDYYTHVVFELQANIEGFGSQNALGGGGRYDDLVAELGGPHMSGIGFALGLERLLLAAELQGITFKNDTPQYVAVLHMDSECKIEAYHIYKRLLDDGIDASFDFSDKAFKTQLKHAISNEHTFAIIVGKDEINTNTVQIKHLLTQTQEVVSMDDILTYLKKQ
jgi:histidyl-tRNA synthetase